MPLYYGNSAAYSVLKRLYHFWKNLRVTVVRYIMTEKQDCVPKHEKFLPQTRPLRNLEELLAWQPSTDDFNMATIPLAVRDPLYNARPRTLVCHDMKGGYLQDRFVQGYPGDDVYHFYHWSVVDIFVYFSHHFVTIPTPGWTNAGHKHGTQVLGTFITEWDEGKARCDKFLENAEQYCEVADKLVALAVHLKFDGWLLNIENTIEPNLVGNLMAFTRYLTDQMHKALPGSKVIWYDSVTDTGELKWQDELNMLNLSKMGPWREANEFAGFLGLFLADQQTFVAVLYCIIQLTADPVSPVSEEDAGFKARNPSPFFEASDGIFLNYTWKEKNLETSAQRGRELDRLHDIYVGVDVFGRGCCGGGGFNTLEAVEVARQHNLSVAIFAPGWVFEHLNGNQFMQNEDRFWSLLHPSCPPVPLQQLPLATSFCRGVGPKLFSTGSLVLDKPWMFLAGEGIQPTPSGHSWAEQQDPHHHSNISSEDAVEGGNCFKMMVTLPSKHCRKFRLFETRISLPKDLFISYAYKNSSGLDTVIELVLSGSKGNIYLCGQDIPPEEILASMTTSVDSENKGSIHQFCRPMTEVEESYKNNFENISWDSRSYHIQNSGDILLEGVEIFFLPKSALDETTQYNCLLGQFQMVDFKDLLELPLLTNLQLSIEEDSVVEVPAECSSERFDMKTAVPGSPEDNTHDYKGNVDVHVEGTDTNSEMSFVSKAELHLQLKKQSTDGKAQPSQVPVVNEILPPKTSVVSQKTCIMTLSWNFPHNCADYFKVFYAIVQGVQSLGNISKSSYLFLGHTHACAYWFNKNRLDTGSHLPGQKYIFKVQPLLRTGFNVAWNKLPTAEIII